MASARPDDAIGRLAANQFGVVHREQLRGLGLPDVGIARRVERGALRRIHPAVYAVGHDHLELRGRTMAALLWAGPGAVVSHRTAAVLWELLPEDEDLDVHITTTVRSGHQPNGIVVHHVRSLPHSLTSRRSRIPVTTVARTILDLAETESRWTTRRALGEALYQRRTSIPTIEQALAMSPGRRGVKVIRRMLPTAGATHSGVEDRFLPLLAQAGIEKPAANVRVAGWKVDYYWPTQRVVVELDTWGSHGDHLSFEEDRRKSAALHRAGCLVLRFTDDQLDDELHSVLLTIAIALRDRT